MSDASPELTVVCHVRAPLLLEPIDRQIETLQACESEGRIDDLLLRSWPKEVTRSDTSPHHEVLEAYDRFSQWADERGVSIEPPFRERTKTSQVTGETTELLVTPLVCLELYVDDELVGVFPHTEGDETYTTDEVIAELRTGTVPDPLGESPTRTRTSSTDCPACGDELIDGQGLFACAECGWIGTLTDSGDLVDRTPEHDPRHVLEQR
ncbi:HTH domain-containing protein [Halopiger goleimassiliensis]|uniref:HTH domain-containing protein n=1 Tax=Halopiger goleimassiliensis TaxID=1293048 RepID=UPI000677CC91|nr:HTH domain-containing protein [Halopiger goleimassiliensis]